MSNKTTNNSKLSEGFEFLKLSLMYLRLTENILNEMIIQGNKIVSDSENEYEHDQKTSWSDYNIIMPVLFNLYHGIELYLKGLLFITTGECESNHNFSALFKLVKKEQKICETIKEILNTYITQYATALPYLKEFLTNNELCSIDKLYIALRYPMAKQPNKPFYKYECLQCNGFDFVPCLKKIKDDMYELRKEAVKFYKNFSGKT